MSLSESAPNLERLRSRGYAARDAVLDAALAKEEDALLNDSPYAIWSPYASFEAANVLLEALNTEQPNN